MLFLAFFFALFNSACLPATDTADTLALATVSTCSSTAILGAGTSAVTKAAAVCTCVSTYATAIQPQCDANSLGVATSCAAATILDNVFSVAAYDFGADCNICKNPPPSPTFPAACLTCYMKYVSCLTTGYFNLVAYPSIKDRFSLNQTCKCLGTFYGCINSCGSPLSQFVGNLCNAYPFCGCDGSLNVAGRAQIIAYLKANSGAGFTTFSTDIVLQSSGSVLSVTCAVLSTQAGITDDRFICDVNFASNSPDYASFHVWVTNYIGRDVQIAIGNFVNGPVVSLKRDSQEAMVSNTYTFVVTGSGSVLTATFSLFLVLGAVLVLLF
jgi:hypothetical protein